MKNFSCPFCALFNIKPKISNSAIYNILLQLLIPWFVILCIVNYAYQRPLWNDELAVHASLVAFKPVDFFTKPLFVWQNFPHLYLYLIQLVSKPFNFSLLSLRLFSFIFMLLAFRYWIRIAKYELKEGKGFIVYILCWLASAQMIYYAAELKQYSMDLLSSACFVLFLYNQSKIAAQSKIKFMLCLIFLPGLILFSYTSFFFFVFPSYNLVVDLKKDKTVLPFIIIYSAAIVGWSALAYFIDVRLRYAGAFPEYFISFESVGEFFSTFGQGVVNLFSRYLVEAPKIFKKITMFFFAFGLLNMFGSFFVNFAKEKYKFSSMKTIGLIVFLELFLAGCLKKYPFTVPRTSLFFAPVIFYLTITGIEAVKKINPIIYHAVRSLFIVFLVFIAVQLSYITWIGKIGSAPVLWWFNS